MIVSLLKILTKNMNSFTIEKDGIKYLTRYYVFGEDREWGNIFIHHFHRSDMDMGTEGYGLLHNHPFDWSFSFVLTGGYSEERRGSGPWNYVLRKTVRPFTFNFISNKIYHRVDLLDEEGGCWSIFFTGSRKNNTWGFWDRITNEFIPFKDVVGAIE